MPYLYRANEEKRHHDSRHHTVVMQNPNCGSSLVKRREDTTRTRVFAIFYNYVTGTPPLTNAAAHHKTSRWTLCRRFEHFWLIGVPNQPDPNRVYDQIFIDGSYTSAGCLVVAASIDQVIAWHWAPTESTQAYM